MNRDELVAEVTDIMSEQWEGARRQLSRDLWKAGVLDNEDVSRAIAFFTIKAIGIYQKGRNTTAALAQGLEQ